MTTHSNLCTKIHIIEVRQTPTFSKWIGDLRDVAGRARIIARIRRLEGGNFGDAKFFEGIGEMRIHHGPGYRLYFAQQGQTVVILLCGGDKSSQQKDITTARRLAAEI